MLGCGFFCDAAAAQRDNKSEFGNEDEVVSRLALTRARGTMYERVRGLALRDGLTIGDWVCGDIDRALALREWARRQPQTSDPRCFSNDSVDVDLRIEPAALASFLIELAKKAQPPAEPTVTPENIRQAAQRWPVLWSTGSAWPDEKLDANTPAGWENISGEGVRMAREAATAEAIYDLLERAGLLRVTAARRLRAFWESDERVFDALREAVTRSATVTVNVTPAQVATAESELGLPELIRILIDVHERHPGGGFFTATDFREMALNVREPVLRGSGIVTPPKSCRILPPRLPAGTPDWAGSKLRVECVYTSPNGDKNEERSCAEAARMLGMDQLRRRIEELEIRAGVAIGQLTEYDREYKDDISLLLSGARQIEPSAVDDEGRVKVHLELPLERLWRTVHSGTRRTDAPASGPATTQPVKENAP